MLTRPSSSWMSPWREMERLRRDMNRLFGDWPRTQSPLATWTNSASYPAMNVWTGDDKIILTAELPGISLEALDISVEEDTLTLRGERRPEEVEGATYHRRERRHGTFMRTFRLPFRVDADGVEATFKSGVLNISLPRAEEDRPRKIQVRAG